MIAITIARKKLSGSLLDQALTWTTGLYAVNPCRIAVSGADKAQFQGYWDRTVDRFFIRPELGDKAFTPVEVNIRDYVPEGRWPANIIFSHKQGCVVDQNSEQNGCTPDCPIGLLNDIGFKSQHRRPSAIRERKPGSIKPWFTGEAIYPETFYDDVGFISRYFKQVKE